MDNCESRIIQFFVKKDANGFYLDNNFNENYDQNDILINNLEVENLQNSSISIEGEDNLKLVSMKKKDIPDKLLNYIQGNKNLKIGEKTYSKLIKIDFDILKNILKESNTQ